MKDIESKTTVAAFHYNNGVVMASDSQVTMGGAMIRDEVFQKIYNVAPNGYIGFSGHVAAANDLLNKIPKFHRVVNQGFKYQGDPGASFRKFIQSELAQHPDFFLHVLYVYYDGSQFRIVEMHSGGSEYIVGNYRVVGSGMIHAEPVLQSGWKESLSQKDAIKLMNTSMNVSVNRDCFSGGPVNLLHLSPDNLQDVNTWMVPEFFIGSYTDNFSFIN